MKMKVCTKCGKRKKLKDFYTGGYKKSTGERVYKSECKLCSRVMYKDSYYKDVEKTRQKLKECCKKLYWRNPDKFRERSKKWAQGHPEKIREVRRNASRKDRATVKGHLRNNLRNRLSKAVKGISKSASTQKLLGCTYEQLREHLFKQFTKGMSWSNYGKWHVDHKRPISSFDLTKASEQRKCFHYTNLQPLWAMDNILKSSKV